MFIIIRQNLPKNTSQKIYYNFAVILPIRNDWLEVLLIYLFLGAVFLQCQNMSLGSFVSKVDLQRVSDRWKLQVTKEPVNNTNHIILKNICLEIYVRKESVQRLKVLTGRAVLA